MFNQRTKEKIKNHIKKFCFSTPFFGRKMKELAQTIYTTQALRDQIWILEQKVAESNLKIMQLQEQLNFKQIKSSSHRLDYKKFEDQMRGSREEIKTKLTIYESVINKVKERNDTKINALDLGCGRGEWLELLSDSYGIYTMGIDSDKNMIDECMSHDLNVIDIDIYEYLRHAASNSVDIISMFQVAEHMTFEDLSAVLYECQRVLRIGGALIVETPNPENLIVGACNFYFDPTHVTKLPPVLLQALIKSAGLEDAQIMRMHEYPAVDINTIDESDIATRSMANFFNNYADYAVIAYKE